MVDIPPEVRQAINQGEIATVNLVEFLAADLQQLLPCVATHIGLDIQHPILRAAVDALPGLKPMQRHAAAAKALWLSGGKQADAQYRLSSHVSDLARQWAALQIAEDDTLNLSERLNKARLFAADKHFGVREFAWMAVRNAFVSEPLKTIELLTPWVQEEDPNLRRFASELTRPRGVWCAHSELLKTEPSHGLVLLQPLRADPAKYVQDSVANWLNDAAKSRPDWTISVCQRWLTESNSKATQRICLRGQRSIK